MNSGCKPSPGELRRWLGSVPPDGSQHLSGSPFKRDLVSRVGRKGVIGEDDRPSEMPSLPKTYEKTGIHFSGVRIPHGLAEVDKTLAGFAEIASKPDS